jgi:nucleoid DNA-binding protein
MEKKNVIGKEELVGILAEKQGISKVEAKERLKATIETILDLVADDNDVKLIGFGTFKKVHRKGRVRKEDKIMTTGKGTDKERSIVIPAGKSEDKEVLVFKTSVEFK